MCYKCVYNELGMHKSWDVNTQNGKTLIRVMPPSWPSGCQGTGEEILIFQRNPLNFVSSPNITFSKK